MVHVYLLTSYSLCDRHCFKTWKSVTHWNPCLYWAMVHPATRNSCWQVLVNSMCSDSSGWRIKDTVWCQNYPTYLINLAVSVVPLLLLVCSTVTKTLRDTSRLFWLAVTQSTLCCYNFIIKKRAAITTCDKLELSHIFFQIVKIHYLLHSIKTSVKLYCTILHLFFVFEININKNTNQGPNQT